MERVSVDAVKPDSREDGFDRRGLSEPLGATNVAVNRYRLAPGEGFPGGLHAHADQEEVFVVLEGEATFETFAPRRGRGSEGSETASDSGETASASENAETADESGEITVGAREAVRFAPGEFQSGRNAADREVVALALGAPPDSEDVRIPLRCPECGRGDVRAVFADDGEALVCPDCEAESEAPTECPDCGHDEMRVTLGAEGRRPVVACPDCEAEFEDPARPPQ